MYQFREINQSRDEPRLAVDELYINDKTLTDAVPGYRQLSVNGRGLLPYEIDRTEDIALRDGSLVNYQNLPARELVIVYAIKAESSQGLRQSFNKLNEVLTTDNAATERLKIQFRDDMDWLYYGLLSDVEDIDETQLEVSGSFTLLCPDPWKYSGQKSGSKVQLSYAYKVLPDELIVPLSGTPDEVLIKSSNGKSFRLIGSFPATTSNNLTIRYDDDQVRVMFGQADRTTDIAWTTYPEIFWLSDGDTVSAELKTGGNTSSTESVTVKWRDRAK